MTMPYLRWEPYLRWVGSKSRILNPVLDAIGEVNGTFIEPFVGTGVVSLNIQANKYILNDLNSKLITTHKMICNFPDEVIDILNPLLELKIDNYYQLREHFNEQHNDPLTTAALFIYLNRTAFQGLYRENIQGEFNVPVGSGNIKSNIEHLYNFSEYFKRKDYIFKSDDFADVITNANKGDVIYADPPYVAAKDTITEFKYTKNGFCITDQIRLRDALLAASEHGIKVVASNSDTSTVRELYKDFDITEVEVQQSVSGSAGGRGKITELILTRG